MTMTAPPHEGHALLADAGLRRTLTAALRRRVPAPEAEDLAQTVLLDALASPRLPRDEAELRRWVVAIARNKAADFHRRAGRLVATGEDALEGMCEADARSSVASVEAREALSKIALIAGASGDARGRETLGWLVREHEGERLCDIAEDEGLPAPVVRQRIARLRRALRERIGSIGSLLVVALVLGGGAVVGRQAIRSGAHATSGSAIVADATTDGQKALAVLQGRWAVHDLVLDPASVARLEPAERAVLAAADEPGALELVVSGGTMRLVPGREGAVRGLSVTRVHEGEVGLVVRAPDGRAATATLAWEGADVVVRFDDGRLRGHARLARRTRY